MDALERQEQAAHMHFQGWKLQHDARAQSKAAKTLAESASKQLLWERRCERLSAEQKRAFAVWLRQKSRSQRDWPTPQVLQDAGNTDSYRQPAGTGVELLQQRCEPPDDPASQQCLMDAIRQQVVLGPQARTPALQQLYKRCEAERGWDSRPLGAAERRVFLFGSFKEACGGGVLEPFLCSADPNLPSVKSKLAAMVKANV
jgi:hypothetical protein